MSYNIAAGNGTLDSIAAVIRAANADIVALQEVDVRWSARSNFVDQARTLSERLGMQVRFAPIYDLPPIGPATARRQYGVAILSRFPISAFTNHALTRHSTVTPSAPPSPMPGFLDATLDVGGTAVRVFNTHLDYRADPSVRVQQVSEMLAIMGAATTPTLLFGDLNATPDAAELMALLSLLRDAWTISARDPGLTYPAKTPTKRIDYVLVSSHWQVINARVVNSTVSDHRPVVVELQRTR